MSPDPFHRLHAALKEGGKAPPVAIDGFPYGRLLGLTAELTGTDGDIQIRAPFAPHFIGAPGRFHGGVIGAVLEIAGMSEWIWRAGLRNGRFPTALPKPITLTVDYLRPAGQSDLIAAARLVRWGRRVVVTQAQAWQDAPTRPVAGAVIHFLLPREKAEPERR